MTNALLSGVSFAATTLSLLALTACNRTVFPGETEEVPTATEDVPIVVRDAADAFCARMGNARVEHWCWDREDGVWEVAVLGLSRRAEMDIEPDGTFSELELVYAISEVEQILPDLARKLNKECSNGKDPFVELSLRRVSFLDRIPELAEAWTQSGVVMECQCANGRDIEIDALGMENIKKHDDTSDLRRDD